MALLAAFASCEYPSKIAGPTHTTYLVSTMYAIPDSVTLLPTQSVQFMAYGRTARGDSVPVTVNWSALGGNITSGGLYSAGGLDGDYAVVATLPPSGALGAPTVSLNRMSVVHIHSLALVAVVPASASILTGGTQQFAAYGRLSNGDSVPVTATWSATGGTISASGLYTAGATPGGYVVTATVGRVVTGTATVTVIGVPVASVAVSPAALNLSPGSTQQLSAVVKDASGNLLSGRTVTWATSNSAIATVSPSGLATGVAVGQATLTATSEGKSGTATVTVATLPVASVTVSPNPSSLYLGATARLVATLKDANGNVLTGRSVAWTTSNSATATVDSTGLTSGAGLGTATITATSGGQSGSAAVTVSAVPVASVTITPTTASIFVGAGLQLTATAKDSVGNALAGRAVTWSSSNTAVVTVSLSGLVTGAAAGTATITATSEGKSASVVVTVLNVPVASVVISPATAVVLVGATVQLVATPRDSAGNALSGRSITWSSSGLGTATVSSGLVTGVAPGAVTITATSEGKTGSAAVTVNPVPVASVSVSPAAASVLVGQAVQLTAVLTGVNGQPVTGQTVSWTSSNPAVAAVSSSGGSTTGVVTGVAAGTATITATSGGKSGTAVITVTGGTVPVASVTVSPATGSVAVGQALQLTATPKDAAGNPLVGRVVTWATSNATVATVSGSGLASGVLTGSVTITATSEGQSGSATITVTTSLPYAVPDLLNNASFETDWSGFLNWAFQSPPDPTTGTFSISRSQDVAYSGTWSAKSTFGPNGSDMAVHIGYPFTGQLDIHARIYFYISGGVPNNHHKWIRFETAGYNGVQGGLYLSSATGGVTWADVSTSPNSNVDLDLGIGIPTFNTWHSIEVEYDRTNWSSATGPRVRFWYDGNVVAGSTLQGTAFWGDDLGNHTAAGPWLYIGNASSSASPSSILVFDDTYNGGNTASGVFYYDRVAISTQRIGP